MTSFKRTQRKYVQKAYRVRNWREYETGLRARGSLTVWLGLTDGKLANGNSPRPTRRKPGRQRKYSNHAIETTVTVGLVFGLASRPTEGFLRSLLTLLNLDNDVPDHSTISRRKARLGKVASYERRTVKPVHLRIDSSGLSVHVGQLRTPPKARDYRKLHLAVDEQTSDVVACELTSTRARDASRVASLVGQIERPIASAKADAAYDTGDVYKTLENHRAHRSPKVLIPPRKGAQLALDSAGTRHRPSVLTHGIVRSRAGDRGPGPETVAVLAGGTTTVAPRALAVSSMATVSEAASAVTRTRGPLTAVSRSRARVASSPVSSVTVWTRITPNGSTPRWRFRQPRRPRPPCVAAAHGPSQAHWRTVSSPPWRYDSDRDAVVAGLAARLEGVIGHGHGDDRLGRPYGRSSMQAGPSRRSTAPAIVSESMTFAVFVRAVNGRA